jgi:hypothetical protein
VTASYDTRAGISNNLTTRRISRICVSRSPASRAGLSSAGTWLPLKGGSVKGVGVYALSFVVCSGARGGLRWPSRGDVIRVIRVIRVISASPDTLIV